MSNKKFNAVDVIKGTLVLLTMMAVVASFLTLHTLHYVGVL